MAYTRSFKSRIFGKVLRLLLVLLILLVVGLLTWRMCLSDVLPSSVRHLYPDSALKAAYSASDGNLAVYYQDYANMTYNDAAYGYFTVMSALFIPEAQQLQIVIRYNVSTLKAIAKDFDLETVPDRNQDVIDVTVVKTAREGDNVRYLPDKTVYGSNTLYNYERLVFNGITTDDMTIGVFVDFYYTEMLDYDESPLGAVLIYDTDAETLSYRLTASDRRALQP
ncbi:MAG: hypothetical protein IJR83_05065 [Clostridia bacterium]|nr:hypothetical protein [Clostridia bacterium]